MAAELEAYLKAVEQWEPGHLETLAEVGHSGGQKERGPEHNPFEHTP